MTTIKKSIAKIKWLIPIIVLSITFGCQTKNAKESTENSNATNPVKVTVEKVIKGFSNDKLSYDGTVIPTITTPLSFLLPGTVSSVFVDEGDFVKKGQLLAKIDNTSYLNAYK
jgi:multidrug efflux pump subunit AcrA (membrane-fusion protein)